MPTPSLCRSISAAIRQTSEPSQDGKSPAWAAKIPAFEPGNPTETSQNLTKSLFLAFLHVKLSANF
eukprot:504827-Amorphochlora_amoeboformis.AAC.1